MTRLQHRWDERMLHLPSDISVIFVALMSASSLGVIAIVALIAVAVLAAVVFSA